MTSAPQWANERPEIHDYDPTWPARAEVERAELLIALGPWLVNGIEHIGSTSVPGLAAKPIIDLMASVTDMDAITNPPTKDWVLVPPHLDGRPWRRFFVKPDPTGTRRRAHLHVITAGHPRWSAQLRFRDALRADPKLAGEYAALKRRLAVECAHDREAYGEGKSDFVAGVLRGTVN